MTEDLAAWLTQIWDERQAGIDAKRGWSSITRADGNVHVVWRNGVEEYMSPTEFDRTYQAVVEEERELVRIAADRQILAYCAPIADLSFIGSDFPPGDMLELAATVLAALALPYADRPGYQEGWRPRRPRSDEPWGIS